MPVAEPVPLISLVVPAFGEAEGLPRLHAELCSVCDALPYRFEFLIVDDGSQDQTLAVLEHLRQKDPRVRYLALSRNFGHQAALSAGLEFARGAAVISLDADLQHPPGLLPEFLVRWEAGYDVVQAVRTQSSSVSWPVWCGSQLFYALHNCLAEHAVTPGAADFRLLSRRALEVLLRLPERRRLYRGLIPWLGFRQVAIPYVAPPRKYGRARYRFRARCRLAFEGLVSQVGRAFCGVAMLAAGLGIASGSALLACNLSPTDAPLVRWFAWQFLFLSAHLGWGAVCGALLQRVFEQVQGRPDYVVALCSDDAQPHARRERPRRAGAVPHARTDNET